MFDKLHIGIDVSKDWVDVAVHGSGKVHRLANSEAAINHWINQLDRARISLVCFEPTGGYERVLKRCLSAVKLPFARVHPNEVVAFRRWRGVKAKTDPMDAMLLAAFCALELSGRGLAGVMEGDEALRELTTRRRQLTGMRDAETCRLAMADSAQTRDSIRTVKQALEQSLASIEHDIDAHIADRGPLRVLAGNLRTVTGVGSVTVHTMLGELPELGRVTAKQIGALVGLAPRQNDSGRHRGHATTGHGRPGVRRVLFNAARTAIRHNPQMRELYRRLTEDNKRPGKVAMTAVMRHLLVILNAIARDNQPWKGAEMKPARINKRAATKLRHDTAEEKGSAGATVQSQAQADPFSSAKAAPCSVPSRDETQGHGGASDVHQMKQQQRKSAIKSSRNEIQAASAAPGRKPQGEQAMTGAERQARYRARHASETNTEAPPAPTPRATAARLTRPQRWTAATGELETLIAEYAAWYNAMPEQLRDTPTGEALLAITELNLEEITTVHLPKGFGRD